MQKKEKEEVKSSEALAVPERLKSILRSYVSFGNGTVSETSDRNQWEVSDSDSEYSGYHDESIYYTSKAIVSARKISLNPVLKQCTMLEDDAKKIRTLLQGFEILEISRFFFDNPSWPWETIDCRYVKLGSGEQTNLQMKNFWVVLEDIKTR